MASKRPWIYRANLLHVYGLLLAVIAVGVLTFGLTYGTSGEPPTHAPALAAFSLDSPPPEDNTMDILPDPTPSPTPAPASLKGRLIPFFSTADELWGYKNTLGQVVFEPRFTSAREFIGKTAFAADASGRWGLFSINGVWLREPQWSNVQEFSESYAAVMKDDKWGYIDASGTVTVDYQFREARGFHCGRAVVRTHSLFAYIDIRGNIAVSANWRAAQDFSEDLAFATSNEYEVDRHYIIDKVGEKRATLGSKLNGTVFSEGFAVVHEDGSYSYMNTSGRTAFKLKFQDARAFANGYAAVKQDGKWGFINNRGVMVIPAEFTAARSFTTDGMAAAQDAETGKWGYISHDGTFSIAPSYDDAQDFAAGFALAKSGSAWYLLNAAGESILFYES